MIITIPWKSQTWQCLWTNHQGLDDAKYERNVKIKREFIQFSVLMLKPQVHFANVSKNLANVIFSIFSTLLLL